MNQKTYFLGDTHTLDILDRLISNIPDEKNYTIVHVGDCGEGFASQKAERNILRELYKYLDDRASKVSVCRGNHSDPQYFSPNHWANQEFKKCIEFVQDYTIMDINGLTYQFIGGAISIDRTSRTKNVTWWENEIFVEKPELATKVDVLVTHTAPHFCHPVEFSKIVYDWAQDDSTLLSELSHERQMVTNIFNICQPKLHVYGHFHQYGNSEMINGCKHRQLGIDEFWTPFAYSDVLSNQLEEYLALYSQLKKMENHNNEESDKLRDKMDPIYYSLTPCELAKLKNLTNE